MQPRNIMISHRKLISDILILQIAPNKYTENVVYSWCYQNKHQSNRWTDETQQTQSPLSHELTYKQLNAVMQCSGSSTRWCPPNKFHGLAHTTCLYGNNTNLYNLEIHESVLCLVSPEREKGEELCPLVPPFSLLLREEDELGLDVDALLENWRVLQSEKPQRGHRDMQYVTDIKCNMSGENQKAGI